MKLRLSPNTIRLRLTEPEVKTLVQTGTLEERVRFGETDELVYSLSAGPESAEARVVQTGSRIAVVIPADRVEAWARSGEVGIHASRSTDGETLEIVIERDLERSVDR
jgi:hypothetical protein